jgi:hypothetical protein
MNPIRLPPTRIVSVTIRIASACGDDDKVSGISRGG